ncbi:hypothetical protein [Streptomyces lincolnensis]|uniref:hypothetical protein n=1 Tax=Streptomyces lincolnensis TaxID=1915 RepID=UPI000832679C|nr:hypothetical protein [Streptomyces lincolnensis]QMV09162.1 hypothetical protein GJU35_28315 [Streptomyces lincolnensis]
MTTTLATAPRQACGCGEEQLPGLLARVGLFGTLGLALAALVVMILAGWLLSTGVWLLRRRGERAGEAEEAERAADSPADSPGGSLAGFTWTAEDP